MAGQIFAYILHKDGVVDDTGLELIAAAKKIDADASATAIVLGAGAQLDAVCSELTASYSEVWKIDNDAVAYANAEVVRGLLVQILPADSIALIPHEHFGMDLAPGLSIKLDASYVADIIDIEGEENGSLKVVRQEYSGMAHTHSVCNISSGAVITTRPGSFKADESKSAAGQVVDKSAEAVAGGIPGDARRYLEIVEAEVGDVDITKSEILVSVGRGVEDEDNLEMVFDLAEAMGGDVSCSRPVVDAKWLEKSRQVGTSGQTVKPKVYMALGISGSFQHVGGIKGSPFIVAVNKNQKAPIFQIADVGVVADILDFMPELTDRINEVK